MAEIFFLVGAIIFFLHKNQSTNRTRNPRKKNGRKYGTTNSSKTIIEMFLKMTKKLSNADMDAEKVEFEAQNDAHRV
jgi:hypothetical protein